MEATQMTINRQVDKNQWYIYTIEYYLTIKKYEMLLILTAWVDQKGICQVK